MKKNLTVLFLKETRRLFFLLVMSMMALAGCKGNEGSVTESKSYPGMSDLSDSELKGLADSFYESNEYERALPFFEECLQRNIYLDEMSFRKGVSLHTLGRKQEAVQSFSKAIEYNPRHVKAHFNLGATYYELNYFEESIASYESAKNLEPMDDQILYGIAASQFALGFYAQSRENAKEALRINPNNENARELIDRLNSFN